MRILLAGATGVIGRRLVPNLVRHGHTVIATTRTPDKAAALRADGAEPVVLDGLDRKTVVRAVVTARPDVVIHQMTSLASMRSLKHFDREFAVSNRLRTEGLDNLLAGIRVGGGARLVVQSYTGWPNSREGGPVKTEDDPLDAHPSVEMTQTLGAIRRLEGTVLDATDVHGIVLRYGSFYGPGTSFAPDGEITQAVLKRQFPIVGGGTGVWSFIHLDDVAEATRLAVEHGPAGVYNIVDDDPAAVNVWLPELARILGAKPPFHVAGWIGRLLVGEPGVSMMTHVRGSSNAKATRALQWTMRYPSWRDGFRRELEVVRRAA